MKMKGNFTMNSFYKRFSLNFFNCLMLFFIFLAGKESLAAENLAPNPGFEAGMQQQNWTLWPASEGPGKTKTTFVIDSEVFKEGAASGRLAAVDPADAGSLYCYVSMKGGKNYRISFWYRLKDLQISSKGSFQVALSFNKERGGNGSAGSKNIEIPESKSSGDWIKFESEITAPPETAMCQFAIVFSGVTGTVWFDDVVIEEIVSAADVKKTAEPAVGGKLDDSVK
jgi:hypothetical protein